MSNIDDATSKDEIKNALRIAHRCFGCDAVRSHFDEFVRSKVECTLNRLLDAEDDQLHNAKRYERSAERSDTRAGSY